MKKIIMIVFVFNCFLISGLPLYGTEKKTMSYPMIIELNNKESIPVKKIQINTEAEKRLFDYVFKNAIKIYYNNLKIKLFDKYNIYNAERADNSSSVIAAIIATNKKTETAFFLSDNNIDNLNRMINNENLSLKNYSDDKLKQYINECLDLTKNSFRHFIILETYKDFKEMFVPSIENTKRLELIERFKNIIKPIKVTRTDKGALVELYLLIGDNLIKRIVEVDKQCKLKIVDFPIAKDAGPEDLDH